MPGLILPSQWTSQPQVAVGVNWAHPLTQGLVVAWNATFPLTNFASSAFTPAFQGTPGRVTNANGNGYTGGSGTFAGVDFNFPSWPTSAGTILIVGRNAATGTNGNPWDLNSAEIDFLPFSNELIYSNAWATARWLSGASIPAGTSLVNPYVAAVVGSNVASSHAYYVNGVSLGTANATWSAPTSLKLLYCGFNAVLNTTNLAASLCLAWNRRLTDEELAWATRSTVNPWQIFAPLPRRLWSATVVPAGTLTGDVTTTGWTATPSGAYYATLDEATASDTDYITSPTLGTGSPITMSIESVPAGSYDVQVRAAYAGSAGQVRVVLLNASNVSQGTSSWQTLTASAVTYTLPVTTTGAATRIRIEVQ
jgi:hypothetical protein